MLLSLWSRNHTNGRHFCEYVFSTRDNASSIIFPVCVCCAIIFYYHFFDYLWFSPFASKSGATAILVLWREMNASQNITRCDSLLFHSCGFSHSLTHSLTIYKLLIHLSIVLSFPPSNACLHSTGFSTYFEKRTRILDLFLSFGKVNFIWDSMEIFSQLNHFLECRF